MTTFDFETHGTRTGRLTTSEPQMMELRPRGARLRKEHQPPLSTADYARLEERVAACLQPSDGKGLPVVSFDGHYVRHLVLPGAPAFKR